MKKNILIGSIAITFMGITAFTFLTAKAAGPCLLILQNRCPPGEDACAISEWIVEPGSSEHVALAKEGYIVVGRKCDDMQK